MRKTPRNNRIRLICLLTAAVLAFGLSGCADPSASGRKPDGQSLRVVATVFPAYDWIRNVLGENPAGVELTLLMDTGADLHNYQPTAKDILSIADADLFVYVGGESDEWVEDALETARNDGRTAVSLLGLLGDAAREEETVEGMQPARAERIRRSTHGETDHDHDDGEAEYDEHVWLSLRNAAFLTERIAEELAALDPANGALYEANAKAYGGELAALDRAFGDAVRASGNRTLLFGDRFPFLYLTSDYGLDYYAAFSGCAAETEASFETVLFLAEKVDELGLTCVLTIDGADTALAETIVRTAKTRGLTIRTLDSMQSVTRAQAESGATYESRMKQNLEVLKEALR